MLDLTSGHKIHALQLGEPVLGSPLLVKTNNRHIIVIPTLRGRLLFIEYINILIAFGRCRSVTIDTAALGKQGKSTYNFELAAQPGWSGSLVLQGIVRKTYDKDPPLIAVDPISLAIRWIARAAADYQEHFGNLRSPPVVVDREAVLAPAYSSKVLAVSIDTGMMTWSVDLGQSLFEQWAGPIASGRSIFIARHDGYLHKISSEHRRREWSIYLGDESRAGAVVAAEQKPPEFADSQAWTAGASSPILATPALDRGRIYVGTHQGWLYCISNLGDDMRSALHQ
jgi:outer membrane protein assembly factor BamB